MLPQTLRDRVKDFFQVLIVLKQDCLFMVRCVFLNEFRYKVRILREKKLVSSQGHNLNDSGLKIARLILT